jgi:hypothetical protein
MCPVPAVLTLANDACFSWRCIDSRDAADWLDFGTDLRAAERTWFVRVPARSLPGRLDRERAQRLAGVLDRYNLR